MLDDVKRAWILQSLAESQIMSMSNQEWRDARRDANRVGLFGLGWGLTILITCALVGVIGWGLTVATSKIRGEGDAVIQKNSSSNWVTAQREFNRTYQEIKADDRKINDAKIALDEDPNNMVLKTNYEGLKQHCNTLVGSYNTDARSYLKEEFRDADLPSEISMSDPSTDCKENTK